MNILRDDKALLADTIEITRAAGAEIMKYYHSTFEVEDKSPDNPVTDADYAADTLLKERLTARLPRAGWLSEETVDSPERLDQAYVWVVDPLDGTKEFVMVFLNSRSPSPWSTRARPCSASSTIRPQKSYIPPSVEEASRSMASRSPSATGPNCAAPAWTPAAPK